MKECFTLKYLSFLNLNLNLKKKNKSKYALEFPIRMIQNNHVITDSIIKSNSIFNRLNSIFWKTKRKRKSKRKREMNIFHRKAWPFSKFTNAHKTLGS